MKKLLIAAARRADGGHGARRHHAEARRGDHQPGAHRDAEVRSSASSRRPIPASRSRSSRCPGAQAFEKFATMVPAGEIARRGRDAGHAGCRSMPTTASSRASSPISPSGSTRQDLTDRALRVRPRTSRTPPTCSPTASICARMFYNKKLFKEAGLAEPPKTLDEFVDGVRRRSPRCRGKYGYCLRGGPGGLNGWMMFGATMDGSNDFFNEDGTSTMNEPGLGQGPAVAGRPLQERATRRRTASTGASTRSSPASIPAPAPCSTRIRTR